MPAPIPLEQVRALNYDHHRRMTELHQRRVQAGLSDTQIDIDGQSYRALLRHVPGWRTAILEIGAASGGQFRLLRDWTDTGGTIRGLDLYEPLVTEAQHHGLDVVLGFVEDMAMFPDASFDLVCSRHVMEHLGDLARGMREILRVTKPGGYTAHVTPNMPIDHEPAHLNHLDERGWRLVWERAGLIVTAAERHPFNGGEVMLVGTTPQ